MERISIDNGLKSFEIADNEGNVRGVISFNPSDFGFIERAKKVQQDIIKYADTIPEDASEETLVKIDKTVRDKIDELFSSNVSEVIFGNVNCVSFSGGKPLFRKALETLIPIVSKTIVEEMKKIEDHINKYTKGIIK